MALFAHGSGSSRHSRRNQMVARRLREAGFSTVLVDLLTPDEERGSVRRFDIDLLADRLGGQPETESQPIGLFGASTGAAAALVAEPGALEQVSAWAAGWFKRCLTR